MRVDLIDNDRIAFISNSSLLCFGLSEFGSGTDWEHDPRLEGEETVTVICLAIDKRLMSGCGRLPEGVNPSSSFDIFFKNIEIQVNWKEQGF